MDWIAKWEGLRMCHAFNRREQRIEGVKVDGLAEDGTVLEFHRFSSMAMQHVTRVTPPSTL